MDFKFTPEDESFGKNSGLFCRPSYPDLGRRGPLPGRGRLGPDPGYPTQNGDRGWLTMHWPEEYGGQGASPVKSAIFNEEIAYLRAPGRDIFGVRMLGPTLMIHGSEEQKRTHLPPVARGEVQWCQGYSEPESGSDLASLSTRAVRDGDDLVINGGKIWTTLAHRADWIMLLTRTDPDAPKHRGISFVLVDMNLRACPSGHHQHGRGHEFNQVLFDNVRVPRANVVVKRTVAGMWRLRCWTSSGPVLTTRPMHAGCWTTCGSMPQRRSGNGQAIMDVPWVRSLMADRYIECEVARLIAYNVAYMQGQGLVPPGSLDEQGVRQRDGPPGNRGGDGRPRTVRHSRPGREWAPLRGRVQEHWMLSFSGTIAAGTSEVQRNIIAGRGLGLPRG